MIKIWQRKRKYLLIIAASTILIVIYYYYLYWIAVDERYGNTAKKNNEMLIGPDYREMHHIPLDEIYKGLSDHDTADYSIERDEYAKAQMIITPTCKIPLMMIRYNKTSSMNFLAGCGNRAVFFTKIDGHHVRVMIKNELLELELNLSDYTQYDCCVRFLRKTNPKYDRSKFTPCRKIEDGQIFLLESDFVNVRCKSYNSQNVSHAFYDDMYSFTKKKAKSDTKKNKCRRKYNVLMLGIDTMSLSRIVQTMTRTVAFLKNNYWLGYRGYHKVGENTLPNIMAAFTGLDIETITEKCSNQMDTCNELMIWKTFQESGYVTAYGEDYVLLPDTFTKNFSFINPPTDHYMKPFFSAAEQYAANYNLLCTGMVSSGQQLLDYALDFVTTYRNDSFFGFFWLNSFSHNPHHYPENADRLFENFFNRLFYTGILSNTFIIFFSDHGLRFGPNRLDVEGYYDDRLPFLFISPPSSFKLKYPESYKAMAINQFRLMTPYDLHKTLIEIQKLSTCQTQNTNIQRINKTRFKHQNIFNIISENRTCSDVNIDDKWCSCHNLYPLDENDTEGSRAIQFFVSYIKNMTLSITTKNCSRCLKLEKLNVIRIHFYYDNNNVNIYYVIAVEMTPGNMVYEATVLRTDSNLKFVGRVNIITEYSGFGTCTVNHNDRIFCFCLEYKCKKT